MGTMLPSARVFLADLARLGRPSRFRAGLRSYVSAYDLTFLALPFLAIARRLAESGDPAPLRDGIVLLGLGLAFPFIWAAVRIPWRRGDPFVTARTIDRVTNRDERFVTAVDVARKVDVIAMAELVVARAARELVQVRLPHRAVVPLGAPAWKRSLLAAILALMILFIPSFGEGLFGSRTKGKDARAGGAAPVPGDREGDATARGGALGLKLKFAADTDRMVYVLGEDIDYRLSLTAITPLPKDVPVVIMLEVDGRSVMELPLAWKLPEAVGETISATLPLKALLERAGIYKPGLLTVEATLRPRVQSAAEGVVSSGPTTIQISENVRKERLAAPERTQEPKPSEEKRDEPRPEPKPDESSKPEPKKPERPERGGEDPPLPDAAAKPFVIEPLFAGDDTKERETRVYDRDRETADKPLPPTPEEASRDYEKGAEKPVGKIRLGAREERLVRRYLSARKSDRTERPKK